MFLEQGPNIIGFQGRRRPSSPADLSQCHWSLYFLENALNRGRRSEVFGPRLGGVVEDQLKGMSIGVGDRVASETVDLNRPRIVV